MEKGRVTGIGGIFFKTDDPEQTKQWYYEHLRLVPNDYGSLFEFRQGAHPDKIGYAQWSPFGHDSTYFEPSKKEFMINFRVEHIDALVEELRSNGVEIAMEIATYDYGKFAHIIDPNGLKIELWEPVDEVFTKTSKGTTK